MILGLLVLFTAWRLPPPAWAQLSASEEEKLQLLTEPDTIKKKVEKDKSRPPIEIFRSQVAPFDVLPFVKPNHWSSFNIDLKSNDADYQGFLQTSPLRLLAMPQDVIFGREATLIKEQRSSLGFPVLCSSIPKEIPIELIKRDAIRADGVWQASLMPLPAHQMLVMILSKDATSRFSNWGHLAATVPSKVRPDDIQSVENQRYYRVVLPSSPDDIYLSPHPLAWTTLSHVIWEGIPPDALSVSQQQAMLDWLHWGGQLILCGGAGATSTLFRESFLDPYLPGERTGENKALAPHDLQVLADAYPPPKHTSRGDMEIEPIPINASQANEANQRLNTRYESPKPILADPREPIYLADVRPNPGASTIPLGASSPHLLAVERRVGRGRITMLTINPNEPALLAWPGLDTLIRRVILRRPEESLIRPGGYDGQTVRSLETASLSGPDLSWYRIAGRDGLGEPDSEESDIETQPRRSGPGVAEWLDSAPLPRLGRDLLEAASGISIPSSRFVLKVITAYILALVPLNWFVCRVLMRRKELSWLFIPILSLGFAVGVERMAAFDVGFDSSCDEIDLLEFQGDYGRAHLSRFVSFFTTGRGRFELSFPNDPTALALPFSTGRSIGGEDVATSIWRSYPVPSLSNVTVQPRSLSMVRAEQMLNVGAGITLDEADPNRRVTNRTDLELRDAVLISFEADGRRFEHRLGTLAAGASVELNSAEAPGVSGHVAGFEGPDPSSFLSELRSARETRPENADEARLVAWTAKPISGLKIEPAVDRHRGSTVVVAHLRFGPPPDPGSARYNLLANGPEVPAFHAKESDFGPPPLLRELLENRRGRPSLGSRGR
jgi:hypothetical protein